MKPFNVVGGCRVCGCVYLLTVLPADDADPHPIGCPVCGAVREDQDRPTSDTDRLKIMVALAQTSGAAAETLSEALGRLSEGTGK